MPSRFMELKLGESDPATNVKIAEIILQDEDYVVYLDEFDAVWWDYERESSKLCEGFRETQARVGVLTSIPVENLPKPHKHAFREMIGEAMSILLDPNEKDNKGAEGVLDKAEAYFKARANEQSRRWTVITGLVWVGSTLILSLLLWLAREGARISLGGDAFDAILCSCAGVAGAYLSVSLRLGTLDLDFNAGLALHAIETSSRLLTGALAAVATVMAIKAKILLGTDWLSTSNDYLLGLASLLAGTSERLIPSMVKRFDGPSDPPKTAAGRN